MNFNMRLSTLAIIGLLGCSQHSTYARRLGERGLQEEEACPRIGKNTNFNQESLAAYVSGEWYVHEQAVTTYLPEERNYCVTASYKQFQERSGDIRLKSTTRQRMQMVKPLAGFLPPPRRIHKKIRPNWRWHRDSSRASWQDLTGSLNSNRRKKTERNGH